MNYPKIFITDLAAYNAGELVGDWFTITPTTTEGDIEDAAQEIMRAGERVLLAEGDYTGPHEEWFVSDYEGFGPLRIDEYQTPEVLITHAENMGEDPELYFAYIEYNGEHYAENFDPEGVRRTGWTDMEGIAGEYLDEFILPEIPEALRATVTNYFDLSAFARDLEIEGTFVEYNGELYEIMH